jgi:isocitrate/isopropylmalate dehydrogenase
VHGSAPDLAGKNTINPTAMLLTGTMMLEYFGYDEQANLLARAIQEVYRQGEVLTSDQGGQASTSDFFAEVRKQLLAIA